MYAVLLVIHCSFCLVYSSARETRAWVWECSCLLVQFDFNTVSLRSLINLHYFVVVVLVFLLIVHYHCLGMIICNCISQILFIMQYRFLPLVYICFTCYIMHIYFYLLYDCCSAVLFIFYTGTGAV